jgi:hypothetical protein
MAGPFVYSGSGKKGGSTENGSPPQCAKKACAIQWCLARRDNNQAYCQDYIDAWNACATHFKNKAAEEGRASQK